MKSLKIAVVTIAALASANAFAAEYTMTCEEALTGMELQVTDEARERFAELQGSCMGVIDRDGELYMHTEMVVRRVRGNTVTLYLPATDHTFSITPDSNRRIQVGNREMRTRDLVRGQELNLYVAINAIAQPTIQEVAFEEAESITVVPATPVAALPTTG